MAAVASLQSFRHDQLPILRTSCRPLLSESIQLCSADGMPPLQPPHTAGLQQQQSMLPLSSQSTFDESVIASSTDTSQDVSVGMGSLRKRRRSSKDNIRPDLKLSVSQPHLRHLAHLDATKPPSPSMDKKRNKLGYHRTSVACGHCRRRKIRCLLAPDDPAGRCSNCIRLKKECNFYPVDQGEPNKGGNMGSIIAHGPPSRTYGALTLGAVPGSLSLPSHPKDLSLTTELGPSPYYNQMGSLGSDQWSSLPHFGTSSASLRQSISGDSSSSYWSQLPSSASSISSSIGNRSGIPGILPSSPDNSYPYPQSQMPWANQRSLSFSHVESMPSYPPYTLGQQQSLTVPSYSFPLHTLGSTSRSPVEETVPASLPSSTLASQMQPSYQVQSWDSHYDTPTQQTTTNQYSPQSTRGSFNSTSWPVSLDESRETHAHPSQQR